MLIFKRTKIVTMLLNFFKDSATVIESLDGLESDNIHPKIMKRQKRTKGNSILLEMEEVVRIVWGSFRALI